MRQATYLWILKIGVYLSLLSVFLVFKSLLFPFITSKQISFNILIEVLLIFWIALLVKYPEYRPKKSYISFGLLSFFGALILSSIFGIDFNLSFWGDVERMLGVFHLLHFLALYFIIITVFREYKDWKILFIISVIFSVFVSFDALGKGLSYATIGNTAYVSGYLIFNMFFTMILFFREKNKELRWIYLLALPVLLAAFKREDTSGAIVGLGFSLLIIPLLYVAFSKSKNIKKYGIIAFVVLSVLTAMLFAYKDSNFVKNNSVLSKVRGINIKKNTFQTRLISWKAGIKDLKNHPLLGTGHGNYAIVFDKYFDPTFYNHTRNETYFDRAHNNLIDIASTAGILGLLTYLSIFAAVGYYLIISFKGGVLETNEFIMITALLIAYFVQNLAVFDSLVTYIGLMIILAYIYWINRDGEEGVVDNIKEKAQNVVNKVIKDRYMDNKEIYALLISGIIMFTILFQYNIKPLQMLVATIEGQRAYAKGQVEDTMNIYKEALSYNTVLDRDSITSLNRLFVSDPNILKGLSKEEGKAILDYNIELAEKNVRHNPGDSLNQMMLAQILNVAASYNMNDRDKFQFYSDRALEAIDKSIDASPGRVPVYFQKAQIYLTRNDADNALDTLRYAVNLNEDYYDSHCYLSKTLYFFKEDEEAIQSAEKCIDLGGTKLLAPASTIRKVMAHYEKKQDIERLTKLNEELTKLEPKNVNTWIDMAKLYEKSGKNEKAIEAVEKAMGVDPSIKEYGQKYIEELMN